MSDDYSPLSGLLLSHDVIGGDTIDRANHRRDDSRWLAEQWQSPTTRVLLVSDGSVPVAADGDTGTERLDWRETRSVPDGERYFLGADGQGRAYFAVHADQLPSSARSGDLRGLASVLPAAETALVVHAIALDNWHSTHRFCPRCGGPTTVAVAGAERRCDREGSSHFPRTDPAVIVLVTDPQGRALLGRQASWPAGRFSTLAGFVEPGESAEKAVIREIAEESGVVVTDVRYLGSQPWPFPASLMLGFHAHAPASDPVADGLELEEVRWFSRAEFAAAISSEEVIAPSGISIARRLIERWYGEPVADGPPGSQWR